MKAMLKTISDTQLLDAVHQLDEHGLKHCGTYAQIDVSHSVMSAGKKSGLSSGQHVGIPVRTMLSLKPKYKHFTGQD